MTNENADIVMWGCLIEVSKFENGWDVIAFKNSSSLFLGVYQSRAEADRRRCEYFNTIKETLKGEEDVVIEFKYSYLEGVEEFQQHLSLLPFHKMCRNKWWRLT